MRVEGIGTRGKGGAALVTAIVFVFFLTLFGLAFYRLGETDIDLFGYDKNLSRALYGSEAGIEKVRWMLREVAAANPYSNTYNEAYAISIANPTEGDFFPGEEDKPYFKVSMIQDASILVPTEPKSKVRVRVLGSVDVDSDGEGGLTASEDVFTYDPDDVNRRFEAYIGLPGTLGERIGEKGISAAAGAFYSGVVQVGLSPEPRPFRTPDGDYVKDRNGDDRFLFFGSGDSGVWDQWGYIFSDPAPTVASGEIDEIELPSGIFDTAGEYVDDDNDTIPDYFQDLNLRIYTGAQTFDPSNDPTAGDSGRSVIYVNGDITIDGVDFGHLNDLGDEIRNCDWECGRGGKKEVDLAFIANGKITVDRVDCGNVGRLVLVAKNITFVGDYDTKVNGIAIAFNDITLDGSGCVYESYSGILTHKTDYSRPVKYAAYFLGAMVAANHINLQNDGWAVIYDENVINGKMYSTTILKPTVTYERAEASDFNSSNNWQSSESTPELLHRQGIYTQDERDATQGDSNDPGDDNDELPEVMRGYTDRDRWGPKDPSPRAINETLSLNFPSGVFEDPDISAVTQPDGSQNWDFHDTITFWMALDNFERTSTDGTKTTSREAHYQIRLRDSDGNTISIPLDNLYPAESEWGTVRYHHISGGGLPEDYTREIRDLTAGEKANGETYSSWKRVKISLNNNDPGAALDLRSLVEFDIRYVDMKVSWTVEVGKPDAKIEWTGSYFRYTDQNGFERSIDKKDNQGDLYNDPPTPNDGYNYLYDDKDDPILFWFKWIEDPNSSTEVRMREEVLMPTLRIDRLELPGKPATNDYLEYGLPHCLRLEVTNWHEL